VNRRLLREKLLQFLFQVDVQKEEFQKVLNIFLMDEENEGIDKTDIQQQITDIYQSLETIDQTISKYLKEWTLDRLATVDRSILRIATFEILYQEDIPVKVSINEAVELAKTFGSNESSKFINGVLGAMVKDHPEWGQKGVKDVIKDIAKD